MRAGSGTVSEVGEVEEAGKGQSRRRARHWTGLKGPRVFVDDEPFGVTEA